MLQSRARKLQARASDDLHIGRKCSPDPGLSQAQSYPLLLSGRSGKKVRFASLETLLPRQQQERQKSHMVAPDIDSDDQERSGINRGNPPGSKLLHSRKVNLGVSRADHENPEKEEKSVSPVYHYPVKDGVPSENSQVSPLSIERALVPRPPLPSRNSSNSDDETPTNSRGEAPVIISDAPYEGGLKKGTVGGGSDQQSRSLSHEPRALPSDSDDSACSSERDDCSSSESDTEEESGSPCNYVNVNGIWPPGSEETRQHCDVSSRESGLSLQSGLPQASFDSIPSIAFSSGSSPHLSNTHLLKANSSHLKVPAPNPTPGSSHFPPKKTARFPYMAALVSSELHSSSVFSSTRY